MSYYFHFVAEDDTGVPRLNYHDQRQVVVGETLSVDGTPRCCSWGLHACEHVGYAVYYVPSWRSRLCAVTLGGTIVEDPKFGDKVAANRRTCVAMLSREDTDALMLLACRLIVHRVLPLFCTDNHILFVAKMERFLKNPQDAQLQGELWNKASYLDFDAGTAKRSAMFICERMVNGSLEPATRLEAMLDNYYFYCVNFGQSERFTQLLRRLDRLALRKMGLRP